MAVDLGSTNSSRYYTTPDHASLTLPDGDWTILSVARSSILDDSAQYLYSTGMVASSPPAVNLFRGATPGYGAYAYNDTLIHDTATAAAVTDIWYLYAVSRFSGASWVTICEIGPSSTSNASITKSCTGTSNGGALIHGGRGDLNTARMWRGAISWDALLIGKGLATAEIQDLARGNVVLLDAPYAASVQNVWHYDSKDTTVVTDMVGGLTATQVGTGYGADVADPILPFTPSATKGVTLVLSDRATSSPRAGLTGLVIRWWDSPTASGAPVVFSTTATTNASGELIVDLSTSSLSVGQTGYIDVYKENASADLDFHFSGRVVVGTI